MKYLINQRLIFASLAASLAVPAFSQADRKKLLIHPFQELDQGFSLDRPDTFFRLQSQIHRPEEIIQAVMESFQTDLRLQAIPRGQPRTWLHSVMDSETYHFEVDGVRICQFEVRTHVNPKGRSIVLGDLPLAQISPSKNYRNLSWPSINTIMPMVESHAKQNQSFLINKLEVVSQERCLWLDSGRFHQAWNLELVSPKDGLLYQAIVGDQKVYDWQPRYFHTTGTATIYGRSPADGELQSFELREMNGSPENEGCYLQNKFFRTQVDESNYTPAFATDCDFVFSEDSSEFRETSLFTNANRFLEWLESHGYNNFGNQAIRIKANEVFNMPNGQTDVNNALYQPGSQVTEIRVGNGDGNILQNLAIDADVISHELGHHVVFHSITQITGESLVVHEGLADYLTFAKTGDPCLGRSICPESASPNVCYVPQQCLRTAANELRYPNLPPEAHLRSQFISGFLWDLTAKDNIPRDTVIKLLLNAIDLLVSNSGYQHLVLGLMLADDSLHDGEYCEAIYDRAASRGLSPFLEGIVCGQLLPLIEKADNILPAPSNDPPASGGTQQRSSSGSWCGQVGFPAQAAWSLVLMLLLPGLAIFFREP